MINIDALRKELCTTFCRDVGVMLHNQNEAVVHLPISGRDGDCVTAYVTEETGGWRVSDKGATMMRLSYENDLDRLLSGSREKLYQTVLQEAGLIEDDGELSAIVSAADLVGGLFSLAQGIVRVEDMGLWTRSRVESTFYEDLHEILTGIVKEDDLVESYVVPNVADADSYPIDFMIKTPGKPLYLFGVLNRDKAQLATIILQYLLRHAPKFDSMVVFSDMDTIPKLVVRRLMAVANDIVPSIQERDAVAQKIRYKMAA